VGSEALRGPFEGAPEGSRGLQRTGPARGESQAGLGRPSESLILAQADVVILGVAGVDAAAEAAFLAAGAQSVSQLAITQANADTQAVFDQISAADVVWMRGGDQWRYVNWWGGTRTEDAIRAVFAGGGVVGGTSAGCAVLGEVIYDARNGTVYSDEALQDPYIQYMTFSTGVFELGAGTIFDTHFTERGRLGRLTSMVGRLHEELGLDLVGVGVDDRTALCVYPDRTAEVLGEGAVTFVHATAESEGFFDPGEAPAFTRVRLDQLTEGYRYDLASRQVLARPATATLVGAPDFAPGVVVRGSNLGHASLGEVQVLDGGNPSALFEGALSVVPGTSALSRTVVSTLPWLSTTWDENRVGGPQYALHLNPHFLALYVAQAGRVETRANRRLRVAPAESATATSAVLLDAYGMVSTDRSSYVSGGGAVGPRQSVALEGMTLHVLPPGWDYSAVDHLPDAAESYGVGKVNSTGSATRLRGWGSPSVGAAFELRAEDGVPGKPALLFRGSGPASTPLLGGTLYVAAPLVRDTVGAFDARGEASFPVAVAPALAGTVRYYQLWHRDPAQADGTGIGLSNGVRVPFRG
jgi:cyanophycinase